MTPADLKSIRKNTLGLSAEGFAKLLGVASGRTVRRWESGTQDVPQRVQIALEAILTSRGLPPMGSAGANERNSQ